MTWIKLHRQLQDSEIWNDAEPFDRRSAWIDLLILASHKERRAIIKNQPAKLHRGDFVASIRFLMKRWRWGSGKTQSYLALLGDLKMIAKTGTPESSIYHIVNYDTYQGRDSDERHTTGTLPARDRHENKNVEEGKRRDSLFSSSGSRDLDSSNPRLSLSSGSEKRTEPCQEIFSFWNSRPGLIHHRSVNGQERFIKAALKNYPIEEIETAISRYSEVRSNPGKFRKVYNWTIGEFLSRDGGKNIIRFNVDNWQEAFMPFGEPSVEDQLEALRRK